MRIAVAGGTGWVGSLAVDAVRAAGHEPVILVRSTGVDMIRRSGLDEALTGGLLPTGPGPRGKQTFDQWRASPAAQNTTGRTR